MRNFHAGRTTGKETIRFAVQRRELVNHTLFAYNLSLRVRRRNTQRRQALEW